jgi:septal ring factor EnvC (AmiA/AmiB activator)
VRVCGFLRLSESGVQEMTDTSEISSGVQILHEMRLLHTKLDNIYQANQSLQNDIRDLHTKLDNIDRQLQRSLASAENDSVEAS